MQNLIQIIISSQLKRNIKIFTTYQGVHREKHALEEPIHSIQLGVVYTQEVELDTKVLQELNTGVVHQEQVHIQILKHTQVLTATILQDIKNIDNAQILPILTVFNIA